MNWKIIGQSVIGSSHVQNGKGCEDAVHYQVIHSDYHGEVLLGFASDGAGSAKFASEAASLAVQNSIAVIEALLREQTEFDEISLLTLAETIYDLLETQAKKRNAPINEFSCTLLGAILFQNKSCFLQIGDGAIVRNDGNGYFNYIWWPDNGEYQNSTSFLIDDKNLKRLKIKILEEQVTEVAIFTDGLQLLALVNESESVHQPFFTSLFKPLRLATNQDHLSILNNKLIEYLSCTVINNRTDDDKTLLLASKLSHDTI